MRRPSITSPTKLSLKILGEVVILFMEVNLAMMEIENAGGEKNLRAVGASGEECSAGQKRCKTAHFTHVRPAYSIE